MPTSTRTSSAIAHTQTVTNTSSASATISPVMWAAKLALEVTSGGKAERTHTGVPRATEREAMEEAEALAEQIGDAVLWFGTVRIAPHVRPAGGGN